MDIRGRLMLVYNPAAGRREAEKNLSDVCAELTAMGWQVTVFPTFKTGDGTEYVRQFVSDYDRVVAMGGDGTLNEVVSGVLDTGADIEVGYVPSGSTNDYASTHGIPTDAVEAAKVAGGDSVHPVDVAAFNDRYVAFHCACGPFAGVVNNTPQDVKNQLGFAAYILDGVKDVATFRSVHVKFTLSDRIIEDDYIYGGLVNTSILGGSILSLPTESVMMDDGKYEMFLIAAPKDFYEVGELLSEIATGSYNENLITFIDVAECDIETDDEVNWSLDGECYNGNGNIKFRVLPRALKLLKP